MGVPECTPPYPEEIDAGAQDPQRRVELRHLRAPLLRGRGLTE